MEDTRREMLDELRAEQEFIRLRLTQHKESLRALEQRVGESITSAIADREARYVIKALRDAGHSELASAFIEAMVAFQQSYIALQEFTDSLVLRELLPTDTAEAKQLKDDLHGSEEQLNGVVSRVSAVLGSER